MTHIKGGGLSHFRRLSWSCIHVLICSAQNWGENPEGVNFYSQEFSSDTGLPQLTVNQQSFVSYSCFRLTSSLLKPAILEVYSPSSHHHRSQLGIVSVLPSCNSSLRAIAGWTTSTEIQAKADRNYLGGCFFPFGTWMEMNEHWPIFEVQIFLEVYHVYHWVPRHCGHSGKGPSNGPRNNTSAFLRCIPCCPACLTGEGTFFQPLRLWNAHLKEVTSNYWLLDILNSLRR